MAYPSVSLCDEANVDGYVHIADEVLRSLIVCMDEGKQDHCTACEICVCVATIEPPCK